METILKTAEGIARQAGEILREYYKKPVSYNRKGEIDLVTEADHAVEKFLLEALPKAFPDYAVVSEEGGGYSPGKGASDYYWYVDPLDGTTNFAHRFPHFAVSLGLAGIDRVPVLGVVYDPMRDECFTGYQGGGAFLNGEKLHVSKTDTLLDAMLATGFPYDRRTDAQNNIPEANAMLLQTQDIRRVGSAALDLCYVAVGRLDGYWERKLNLWDCVAGIVMVQEAGGKVTDLQGKIEMLYEKRPQILASNGLIHAQIIEVLQSV